MARFRLTATHHFNGRSLKAGTVVCNGTACSAGDFIWTGLTSAVVSNKMEAIDAAATTIKNASPYANTSQGFISGADSIDG